MQSHSAHLSRQIRAGSHNPWLIKEAFFPPIRWRFVTAMLLTFFPFGILYPLEWPLRELLTIISWLWVFPSPVGCLSLLLLPALPSETLGYSAFNLLCFSMTLAVGYAALDCQTIGKQTFVDLHRFARFCITFTVIIGVLQAVSDPLQWTAIFKDMSLGAGGRGAGLRAEPSYLAAPLALYLALLVSRMGSATGPSRRRLLGEALVITLVMVILTRSLSVLIVAMCFGPSFGLRVKNTAVSLICVLTGAGFAFLVFGERLRQAFEDTGSVIELMTTGVSSWRNVPDFLIVLNYKDFLLPSNPAEIRTKVNTLAALLSSDFSWIESTFSTFSAGASTAGLVVTAFVLFAGLIVGLKHVRSRGLRWTWAMLYVANWFFIPKFEAAGWVSLGLLAITSGKNQALVRREDQS